MASLNGGGGDQPHYRERLSPSLWVLVAAALCGPMAALVVTPVDTTLALIVGGAVAVILVLLLIVWSPVVKVSGGMLRAGRARIELRYVGDPAVFVGEAARHARGSGLDPRSWHLIRGGIDGVVVVPILDVDDPAPSWVISTRTPERLTAALRRAHAVAAP
ncbi:DUF3093 domain-containing protein [Microbacterium sp. SLBN-146]|uniref:DUF3093 domain-containing protein n=1 Tax=Microbacterium sp. SLBN-146 TaxID=2768457 RepID=UPI0011503966|nr:DUF3093 domain-containing protein [Microbacterium sp. SLBN-146]TQJ32132.1 DUF3093 family protein [Microbacterium sp. SLBN-146]